jgi:peptidoglycan/xylan/chitin deacetylase (PgdA/CDA1 family)
VGKRLPHGEFVGSCGSPAPRNLIPAAILLTFDDGYQTVYDHAFPILQKYGLSATIFPTVAASGPADPAGRLSSQEGRSMLSWHEMRDTQRGGVGFGAHTLTHRNLTRLPPTRLVV